MAFRFINNRAQNVGLKGFIATVIACAVLRVFDIGLSITLPFLMPWLVVWLVGYSMINKSGNDDESNNE